MDFGGAILLLGAVCAVALVALQFLAPKQGERVPQERLNSNHSVPDLDRLRHHWLVAVEGHLDARTWWLGTRIITVGRTPDNLVQVNEEAVSRTHCRIEPSGAGPVVIDLGSSNGTHVNGRLVERTTLLDGDILMVGNQAFRYEAAGNYVSDAAVEWKAAGDRVRFETQVGVSPELQSSIRTSMEKHEGNVAAVTKELKIPAEMVELLMREDDS